ncbi:piggyBac transposable element-derived protein 4-like [Lineus longissimus]|uniref:piggyBac transposable element-derived protein 4-like n=1 Tax=Lineus longissimus TaxID=88925 RepID=UPI00315C78AE
MSRNRFEHILRFLHFNNNANLIPRGQPGYDRLFKLRKIIDCFAPKFMDSYDPGKVMSLDEGLYLWKGRLVFKQYIANKPAKYGIKSYLLCDSAGYTWNFIVCTGEDKMIPYLGNQDDDPFKTEAIPRIVVYLIREGADPNVVGEYRQLYMDRYYNSPALTEHLMEQKIYTCGTQDMRRKGVPPAVKNAVVRVGEIIHRQKRNMTVISWREKKTKKPCTMISNMHNADLIDTGKKRKVNNVEIAVKKPSMVLAYNKRMGGVDKSDQMVADYGHSRKSLKCTSKFFFHLIDIAVLNAFVLFNNREPEAKKLLHLEFKMKFIEKILSKAKTGNALELPDPKGIRQHQLDTVGHVERLESRLSKHWPDDTPFQDATPGKKVKRKTRVCAQCRKDPKPYAEHHGLEQPPKRPETSIMCPKCNIPLHSTPCFKLWHTLK